MLVTVDITSLKRIMGDQLKQLLSNTINESNKLGDYTAFHDSSFHFRTITGKLRAVGGTPMECACVFGWFVCLYPRHSHTCPP